MIINSNGKLTKREVTALEDSYLGFGLSNFLLINTDEILQTRGGGHGLIIYDRLYDDPHVQSVMNKLADAVISRDWVVAPASDKRVDKRAGDIVRDQLTHLNTQDLFPTEENHTSVTGFDAVTRSMIISGRLNGYCCGEVMWRSDGALTVANEVRLRDSRLFGFKKGQYGYTLRFLSKSQVLEGVPVEPKKVVVFSYGALDGTPYGRALGRVLFWPVFFKKQVTRFDLKFLENFSSPKVVGKYPRGTQGAAVDTLMNAIDAIAQETGVAIPEGMLLEYLQASTSGTVDAYERSLKYWDEQISEAVLGETGTTNQSGSGGSRARDQVGNEVRLETSKAIADALSSTFNRLASWITAYNVPDALPPTVYRDFGEAEDLEKRATRDKTLFDMGYRLSGERVIDTYGEGYEEAMTPDKPALISTIGVAGVTALTAILAQAESGQLPRENAVAVLVSVFGIEQADADKMVPAEKPPEQPQANPLDGLFGGQGQQQPGQQPPGQTQFAESTPDSADLITDKARPIVQSALAPWLQTVTDFVEQASSLEEIRDGLADLYPSLDPKDFAEAMGQAMLLSDLAGQSEVLSEADEVAFAEAIEAALNGTLDFAAKPAGSKPKCNPAKSHFCQKPGGKGSCVALSKKCKFKPTGQTKQAADYVDQKVPKVAANSPAAGFPASTTGLKTVQSLGGSTGATLVEDPATGKRYVLKKGASADHIREEYAADRAYEALGVKVPAAHLYETPTGPIKLAEFVEGTALGELKGAAKTKALAELQKDFAADALLGNWDVVGLNQDNVLVTKKGEVYRIDNGGSLRYRAQGQLKEAAKSDVEIKQSDVYKKLASVTGEESALQVMKLSSDFNGKEWNGYPTEIWSLRSAAVNQQTATAFGSLTHDQIVKQIDGLGQKKQALLDSLPPDLKDTVGQRFAEMERTSKISKPLQVDNFTDDYTSEFSRHNMQIREAGVMDTLSKKLKGPGVNLVDENGKEFDNIRGSDGVGQKIATYVNSNGGDYGDISKWKSYQSGSTFASYPTTYRYFMASNRNDVDNVYWGENQNEEKAKAKALFDKYATDKYRNSMTANHAAEFEMLDRLDLPNKNPNGTIAVKRTLHHKVVSQNDLKAGTITQIRQTAFDSTSLMKFVDVHGSFKTESTVPLHRVLGTYLVPQHAGDNDSGFAGDSENEFAVMLNGIDFKAIGTGATPKTYTKVSTSGTPKSKKTKKKLPDLIP